MPDLPGFLNKTDFFGKTLPGYISIILSIFLFWPDYFLQCTKPDGISADIFSAVVFLVAGPAVGYILYLLHRYLYTISFMLIRNPHKEGE